ncbi:MAG: hypothetical protein M3Y18_02075 [Candidatus Eremiobacteraeota bacterium]|nr:hypothetical protein [Candidatus Eremiobacteraeota bacterium]
MHDIVGIKVRDEKRGWVGFITYAGLWDEADEATLLQTVGRHLRRFDVHDVRDIRVCGSLQEISSGKFFYETVVLLGQKRVPHGAMYGDWKTSMRLALEEGFEIYSVGDL